jgi:hypothetical protein
MASFPKDFEHKNLDTSDFVPPETVNEMVEEVVNSGKDVFVIEAGDTIVVKVNDTIIVSKDYYIKKQQGTPTN